MEPWLRVVFEYEIETQCRYMLRAYANLQGALAIPAPDRDFDGIWSALQDIWNAAANIFKLAWGIGKQPAKRRAERAELRQILTLDENSPLFDNQLRDDFEHMDERLETWARESQTGNLTTRGMSAGVPPADIANMGAPFGWFFRDTGDVIFWTPQGAAPHKVSILALIGEAQKILRALAAARLARGPGVLSPSEWAAHLEVRKGKATNSNPNAASDSDAAPRDSPTTAPEAPPGEQH